MTKSSCLGKEVVLSKSVSPNRGDDLAGGFIFFKKNPPLPGDDFQFDEHIF